ncbi:hypothetical protein Tco_1253770 [Tanacetum coccineum]
MNPHETQQVVARDEKWVPSAESQDQLYQYQIRNHNATKGRDISIFRTILDIYPRVEGVDFTDVLDNDTARTFLIDLGYKGPSNRHTNMFVDHMHQPWRTLVAFINKCLSKKTASNDKLQTSRIYILWGMFNRENVDYPELIWEDLAYQINHMKEKRSRRDNMSYPRFTKIIINHFLKQHKSLTNLNHKHYYSIKDDGIVRRLKFVRIGEDYQEYGLPIPDMAKGTKGKKTAEESQETVDVSEESKPEPEPDKKKTSGQIPPKKSRGKGSKGKKTADDSQETVDVSEESKPEPEPVKKKTSSKRRVKKKVTLSAADNIISDDPYATLELGKFISQTKTKEAEAARQVYATHARIVTESVPESAMKKYGGRSSKSVVIQDTPSAPKSKPAASKDQLKGAPSLTPVEQEAANIIQALKERVPVESTVVSATSSEGTSIKPGVPDEDKDITEEKVILELGDEQDSEHSDDDDVEKNDKDGDADEEGDDNVSDTQDADDEDVKTKSDEDGIYKYKIRVRKDEDVEMKDAKVEEYNKGEEMVTDAVKEEVEKTSEAKDDAKKTELPPSSSSLSVSLGFGDQFLKLSSYSSLVSTVKDTADADVSSLLDIPIHKDTPQIQSSYVQKVPVSVIPKTNNLPPIPEIVTENLVTTSAPSPLVTPIILSVQQTTTQIPTPIITTDAPNITTAVQESNALIVVELRVAKLEKDITNENHKNRSDDDDEDDDDEDPPAGPNQGKKTKRRRTKESESSKKPSFTKDTTKGKTLTKGSKTGKSAPAKEPVKEPITEVIMDDASSDVARDDKTRKTLNPEWFKQPPRPPTPDPEWNTRQVVLEQPAQPWFNQMVSALKDSLTFNDLMATPIDFSKYVLNGLKIENLTQDILLGPAFNLLKGTCSSKYLKTSDPEVTYTTSITKTKAARYEIKGIEDMVPTLWITIKYAYDKDAEKEIKHRGERRKLCVKKLPGYGHLEEIVVKRSDQQFYKFKECDFVDLHLNKIEDMLLLDVQHKLFHLKGSVIVDFIVALRMFTRSLILKRRVENLQLGVESYQKKLNITKPHKSFLEIEFKEPYTPSYDAPGIVYEDPDKQKRVLRADELYKFSNGTLKFVHDEIHHRVLDFRLDYNPEMPKRKWTAVDRKRSGLMVELIDKQQREREIIRNLERLVGARELEMDYKLMTRTV